MHRFNQNEERQVGADWEWLIGSDVSGWFGLRIQAKRADDRQYRQLGHPGLGTDDYQYDTLIQSCADASAAGMKFKFFPHYLFFNGLEAWPVNADWSGCPNGAPLDRCSHAKSSDFGCSTTPAQLVKRVHNGQGIKGRRIEPHLSVQVPWSWLFGVPKAQYGLIRRPSLSWTSSPHSVLGWHQAQERVLGAITTLDAQPAEVADGEEQSDDDMYATQAGPDDLLHEFWRQVSADGTEADATDLSAELPPYAAFVRTRAQRGDMNELDFDARWPALYDPAIPKRLLIVNLGSFDG